MTIPDIIIAIDGYSSTGKSSFAKLVAAGFGFLYLDSGALYRGVTLFAQRMGLIGEDNVVSDALETALEGLDLHFSAEGKTCIGEDCVESEIRSMKVSSQVSPIAAVPYVRAFVDRKLHELASSGRVAMDGRDRGTTVFPNAQINVFMTASLEVRARRRYDEMVAKGETPDLEQVAANLQERDYSESHRSTSPLKQAAAAFVLDNSQMSMGEELAWLRGVVQGKFGIYD